MSTYLKHVSLFPVYFFSICPKLTEKREKAEIREEKPLIEEQITLTVSGKVKPLKKSI
ncbi:hypothetical protein [endosymbiont 'TC1' of Trimyema compressum]|uniref:hypothetical protein n=1 Tax=endosymbiont 'TC1' of Trimyema compressum TaxID=243899 RepID=UPI00139227CB|nr:hypothetical protein [endosymbiont 'TC1' of Trimyema compressum]